MSAMLFFYACALPVTVMTVAWGLVWLPSRATRLPVRLDVGLAWLSALVILILVPTDVVFTMRGSPPAQLAPWWSVTYWYTFAICMLLLPMHMELTRRGEFTALDRLAGAARYNLAYYAVLAGLGASGLAVLLFAGKLEPANVLGFCIALSNAYGLVGAIFLMGYGLVAAPKQFWRRADLRGDLQRLCHQLGLQASRAAAAHAALSETVAAARAADVLFGSHDPHRPAMEEVLRGVHALGPDWALAPGTAAPAEEDLDIFDLADLARLRRRLKAGVKDHERERALYVETAARGLALERTLELALRGRPPGGATDLLLDRDRAREALAWAWECHGRFWAYRCAAVLSAAASASVVLAETSISPSLPDLSLVSWALAGLAPASPLAAQALCFAALAYPCACAYYAVYRLGRTAFYRMVPRHTDAYSLCYSALLACRFAPPLAFNFIAALALPPKTRHEGPGGEPDLTRTVFYARFGELMARQPLIGWQFNAFAPLALAPYCLLLLLGAFNPLVALLRRSDTLSFEDDWEEESSVAASGKRLLRVEAEAVARGRPVGAALDGSRAAGARDGRLAGLSSGGDVPEAQRLVPASVEASLSASHGRLAAPGGRLHAPPARPAAGDAEVAGAPSLGRKASGWWRRVWGSGEPALEPGRGGAGEAMLAGARGRVSRESSAHRPVGEERWDRQARGGVPADQGAGVEDVFRRLDDAGERSLAGWKSKHVGGGGGGR